MDAVITILQVIGLLGIVLFGMIGVLQPRRAAALIHMQVLDERGLAEGRVNLGGFFIGLGVMPLILGEPAALQVAGLAYLIAAVARIGGYLVDKVTLDAQYTVLFIFEFVMGVVLML
ncbi:MAG: hypothetical protein Kow00117_00340 [Phototrophicales bacterium]